MIIDFRAFLLEIVSKVTWDNQIRDQSNSHFVKHCEIKCRH